MSNISESYEIEDIIKKLESITFQDSGTYLIPLDFPTIQEAIDTLSCSVNQNGKHIEIRIQSGHQLTHGLSLYNGDYARFMITSEDNIVELSSSFQPVFFKEFPISGISENDPVCFAFYNCRTPILNCLFDIGGQNLYGWYALMGCETIVGEGAGCVNGLRNMECRASRIYARASIWSNAKSWCGRITSSSIADISASEFNQGQSEGSLTEANLLISRGSTGNGQFLKANNGGGTGVSVRRSSFNVEDAEIINNAYRGLDRGRCSTISARRATITDNQFQDIGAQAGSGVIFLDDAIFNTIDIPLNTITNGGIAFKADAPDGTTLSESSANNGVSAVTNPYRNLVKASENSSSSGSYSVCLASSSSNANGAGVAVVASLRGEALSSRSGVIACQDSRTEGAATTSAIIASRRVVNGIAGTLALGWASSGNPSSANRTIEFKANGGNINISGTLTPGVNFSDFAELFENGEGYEIDAGHIVTMHNGKVYIAKDGDDISGVVSHTAALLAGDTPFCWQGRYLTDEFGRHIYEEISDPDFEGDGKAPLIKSPKQNPRWNPDIAQIPRSQRPNEYTPVGLVGQVFVRVDQHVGMNDSVSSVGGVSPVKTGLQCMAITQPFDTAKGYAIARCLINVNV